MLFDHASGTRAVDCAWPLDQPVGFSPEGSPTGTTQLSPHQNTRQTTNCCDRHATTFASQAGRSLSSERCLRSAGAERPRGVRDLPHGSARSQAMARCWHSGDLCLPGGRTPHDFMRTLEDGSRVEVERFQSIRPDCDAVSQGVVQELFVEFDDRLPEGVAAAKLERYDHFLTGWSANLGRYARAGSELPIVVFVCRDRARARECAQAGRQGTDGMSRLRGRVSPGLGISRTQPTSCLLLSVTPTRPCCKAGVFQLCRQRCGSRWVAIRVGESR